MTIKITPEAVKERIAALESAGEISLKEQFYLEALRQLVAAMDSEPVSQNEPISFDEWSRKCALQITLCYPDFREKAQYIWDSARETQQLAPAPVVSADLLHTAASAIEDLLTTKDRTGAYVWFDLPFRLRSAANAQPAPVVPENCVTAEHRRVIEMLLSVCGAAFELADDSCQQDVDGEDCHVVPDDAFQKLSDALDEIENTLPTEDIDRPDVFLAWSAMPRAALKSLLQAQPAPLASEDVRQIKNTAAALEHIGNFADAAIIRQLAANQQQNAQQNIPEIIPESCIWHCEEDINNWHSDCGYQFQFMEDGPEENGVKFCPKCGKSVAVSSTEGTEE